MEQFIFDRGKQGQIKRAVTPEYQKDAVIDQLSAAHRCLIGLGWEHISI
jgi:hypothetical protein